MSRIQFPDSVHRWGTHQVRFGREDNFNSEALSKTDEMLAAGTLVRPFLGRRHVDAPQADGNLFAGRSSRRQYIDRHGDHVRNGRGPEVRAVLFDQLLERNPYRRWNGRLRQRHEHRPFVSGEKGMELRAEPRLRAWGAELPRRRRQPPVRLEPHVAAVLRADGVGTWAARPD